MIVGYSYWGYLGDTKYDVNGNVASTPDGNAFYSWSIINGLLKAGDKVIQIMPDRDYVGFEKEQNGLFSSWCSNERLNAYKSMVKMPKESDMKLVSKGSIFEIWNKNGLKDCDIILHEWRMPIPGRNTFSTRYIAQKHNDSVDYKNYQPDFFMQECLCEYCSIYKIPMIIFDLDYKLTSEMLDELPNKDNIFVFELGYKWEGKNSMHVEIPFDFDRIFDIPIANTGMLTYNIIYVGNRYERDWCIDKYVPTELNDVVVYGNWLESNRDSKTRWPNIEFGRRLQTKEMVSVYNNSVCTLLLAKKEYVENNFMTARIIESIFYGCVPLFIEEYGEECINRYAGIYSSLLTVSSKSDVIERTLMFKYNKDLRVGVIYYLRDLLAGFMDAKYFVEDIHNVLSIMHIAKDKE